MTAPCSLVRLVPALLVTAAISGCGGSDAKIAEEGQALAQADAEQLASEILDLVDQTAGYQSSHEDRSPRNLRTMGLDSLTPTTARWVEMRGETPLITVAFRRLAGHALSSCSAGTEALEQLSLDGAVLLECSLVDGTREDFTVGQAAP